MDGKVGRVPHRHLMSCYTRDASKRFDAPPKPPDVTRSSASKASLEPFRCKSKT